jgi:hypothetical protein
LESILRFFVDCAGTGNGVLEAVLRIKNSGFGIKVPVLELGGSGQQYDYI